jgi:hypothetical protein
VCTRIQFPYLFIPNCKTKIKNDRDSLCSCFVCVFVFFFSFAISRGLVKVAVCFQSFFFIIFFCLKLKTHQVGLMYPTPSRLSRVKKAPPINSRPSHAPGKTPRRNLSRPRRNPTRVFMATHPGNTNSRVRENMLVSVITILN